MTSLVKGIYLSAAANVAALASSLIVVGIAARVVSKEDMGVFFMAMVVALFAGSVADLGLRNGVVRVLSVARGTYSESAMPFLVTVGAASSIALCVVLLVTASVVNYLVPASAYVKPIAWGAVVMVVMVNWQMALAVLVGQQRYRNLSILSLVVEIVRVCVSVVALLNGTGAASLILGIVVSRIAGIAAFCAMTRHEIHCCFNTPERKELLSFSAWGYGSSVVSILTGRLGDFVLNSHLGTAALATYSTAMQIPLILNRGYESIRPVVLAYVATNGEQGTRTIISGSRLMAGALSLMALLVMVSANELVPLLFSKSYADSVPITVILSIWVVVGLTNYFISTALFGVGRSKAVFWFSFVQLPVMLGLCYSIIPLYGGAGAAASLVITSVIGNLLYAFMFARTDPEVAVALVRLLIGTQVPLLSCAYIITEWQMPVLARLAVGAGTLLALVGLRGLNLKEIILIFKRRLNRGE
jgi:O-antigen/teichoic acid export membrane protein